jgi:hypothetical protein
MKVDIGQQLICINYIAMVDVCQLSVASAADALATAAQAEYRPG